MFEGLSEAQLSGAIEAMLFVTDEPVGVIALADMLECDPKLVEQALVGLRDKLEAEQRGIQLREVAGGWRLYTHPAYHDLVEKYVLSWDTRKLSQAAMETLAIVAYLQPCTRAGVASVRGVNSDSSINSLVEKGLVREAGQADAPGNPTLYATTRGFLEKFGLRSVKDLPDLDQYAPDDATRELIRERLSAGSENVRVAPEAQVGGAPDDDPLAGVQFDFDDEDSAGAFSSDETAGGKASASPASGKPVQPTLRDALADDAPASDAAQQMLADAMAQSFGLVEKIDFDNLRFETDDE